MEIKKMNDFKRNYHVIPEQKRAEMAIEAILEAAKQAVILEKPEGLTARELSSRAGYSVGTIYRYFEKIDDVFIHLFMKRRSNRFSILAENIDHHSATDGVEVLVKLIVTSLIDELQNAHPKILKMVIRQFFKRANEPEQFNAIVDTIIPNLIQVTQLDLTGTFKIMSEAEASLMLRAMQAVIRSPFLEESPIAGSEEHRRFAYEVGMSLFSTPKPD